MAEPKSDHYDGRRFFNPGVDTDKTLTEMLRWTLNNARSRWPRDFPPAETPRPLESVAADEIVVTYVGQATMLLQVGALNILTDPFFSDRASPFSFAGPKRARPPGVALDDLPPIRFVLLSHNHYDHMDLPSLRWLRDRWNPTIITGLRNGAFLARKGVPGAIELDWWESVAPEPGLTVTYVPAQHWSSRTASDRRQMLWGGHVVETPAGRIYFAGDSGYGPHFTAIRERLGAPDVALLPIGAYAPRWFMESQHMDPDDAVRAHLDLGARRSIGMHFATIQLTDEAIDEPAAKLREALAARGLPPEVFVAPEFGTPMRFGKPESERAETPAAVPGPG